MAGYDPLNSFQDPEFGTRWLRRWAEGGQLRDGAGCSVVGPSIRSVRQGLVRLPRAYHARSVCLFEKG